MYIDYGEISQSYISSGRSLDAVASFRVMQIMRARKIQVDHTSVPEWNLNNKIKAYDFVDLLGICRPKVISSGLPADEILPGQKIVVKPYNGAASRGVYLVFQQNNIFKVRSKEKIESWKAMLSSMKNDLSSGVVKQDRWIVEEIVLEDERSLIPARDLKFYCFYGKVALIFEVVRYPNNAYCYWSPDKVRLETGAFMEKSFHGDGFSDSMVKVAEYISRHIPSPFIRIDFHKRGSELVFCEFTPRPGATWLYDRKTDQMLGDAYLAAEGRLLKDFLAGKTFDIFNSIVRKELSKDASCSQHAVQTFAPAANLLQKSAY